MISSEFSAPWHPARDVFSRRVSARTLPRTRTSELIRSALSKGRVVFRVSEHNPPFALVRYPCQGWVDTMRSGMTHPPLSHFGEKATAMRSVSCGQLVTAGLGLGAVGGFVSSLLLERSALA